MIKRILDHFLLISHDFLMSCLYFHFFIKIVSFLGISELFGECSRPPEYHADSYAPVWGHVTLSNSINKPFCYWSAWVWAGGRGKSYENYRKHIKAVLYCLTFVLQILLKESPKHSVALFCFILD